MSVISLLLLLPLLLLFLLLFDGFDGFDDILISLQVSSAKGEHSSKIIFGRKFNPDKGVPIFSCEGNVIYFRSSSTLPFERRRNGNPSANPVLPVCE